MPRLVLCVWLIAILWLVGLWVARWQVLPAEPAAPGWHAVLVAGDNAQPVFDNAVGALARWLSDRGVPIADIHRLSASQQPRDPAVEPASVEHVLQRIASLRPQRGERCLISIPSQGQRGEGIWLAASGDYLRPASLARALSA